jgi:sulfoxide reductase heme-binding subunit YedZ
MSTSAWKTPLNLWRLVGWSLGLWPAAVLGWKILHADLGPNPVETLEHFTGEWGLRLLLLTLLMTPLRRWTGRPEPVQIRRLLGLWAYAWMSIHFAIYLTFDLEWSMGELGKDLIKRTYITIGFAAWLLLLPLAITSTRGWQRRLKRQWQRLHQLIYPAVLLGVLHFYWLVKADVREPLVYLALALVLLGMRWPARGILRGRFATRTSP